MNRYAKAINRYTSKYERIKIVDFMRGFCALLMVFDHTMYDLMRMIGPLCQFSRLSMQIASLATTYWFSPLRAFGWVCAVSCFVFLCGFSTGLSKNNLLRGFRLAIISMLITVVTTSMEVIFGMSRIAINFGVLHSLSFCILGYALCIEGGKKVRLFKAKNRTYYLSDLFTIILFGVCCFIILSESIVYNNQPTSDKYTSLAEMTINDYILYAFGICKSLPSSDYIPILPWFAVFLVGAFLAGSIKRKRSTVFVKEKTDFVSFIGRHSLLLYVCHQPIIYGLLYFIGFITTGRLVI